MFLKYVAKMTFILAVIIIVLSVYFIKFQAIDPVGSVVVPLKADGGLGNQMFRYAAGYALAKKTNSKLYILVERGAKEKDKDNNDPLKGNLMLGKFNIHKENIIYKNKINKKIFNKVIVRESNFFELTKNKNNKVLFIDDDFESEIYFADFKADILKMFVFTDEQAMKLQDIISMVSDNKAFCIHVRKNDMLTDIRFFMPIDYQKQAVELANKLVKGAKFFVFSDDMKVAKQELVYLGDISFISKSPLEDFFIMSKCGNNIIANSTFSWWAAYLNHSLNNRVIAPYPRCNDDFFTKTWKDEVRRSQKRILYGKHAYPEALVSLEYTQSK